MNNIPSLHQYWDRPTPQSMGDAGADPIFLQVGIALTAWESVEQNLAEVLRLFVNSDSSVAVGRVYGSFIASQGRADALDAAAEVFFDTKNVNADFISYFKLLIKHFREAGAKRNDIAHGMVTKFTINGVNHGHFLVAPDYHAKKTRLLSLKADFIERHEQDKFFAVLSVYRYTSKDIQHYIEKFRALRDWICDYFDEISKQYPQRPNNG